MKRMIEDIGIKSEEVYIENKIKWRKKGNREKKKIEKEIWRKLIERKIEMEEKKVMVEIGGKDGKEMKGEEEGILRMRGKWKIKRKKKGMEIKVMKKLNKEYMMRKKEKKSLEWREFMEVKIKLEELSGWYWKNREIERENSKYRMVKKKRLN